MKIIYFIYQRQWFSSCKMSFERSKKHHGLYFITTLVYCDTQNSYSSFIASIAAIRTFACWSEYVVFSMFASSMILFIRRSLLVLFIQKKITIFKIIVVIQIVSRKNKEGRVVIQKFFVSLSSMVMFEKLIAQIISNI